MSEEDEEQGTQLLGGHRIRGHRIRGHRIRGHRIRGHRIRDGVPGVRIFDQEQEQVEKETDLEGEHGEHNQRCGGGPVWDGEIEIQRQAHNMRVGSPSPFGTLTGDNETGDPDDYTEDEPLGG